MAKKEEKRVEAPVKGPEFVLRPEMGPRVVAALQAALSALGRSDERLVREFEDACQRLF